MATLDHSICMIKLKFSNAQIGPGLYRIPFNIEKDEKYCSIISKSIIQSIKDNFKFDGSNSSILQEMYSDKPLLAQYADKFSKENWRTKPGYVLQEVINNVKEISRQYIKSRNVEFHRKLQDMMSEMKEIYHQAIMDEDEELLSHFRTLQDRFATVTAEYHGLGSTTADKFRDVFGEQPTRYFFATRGEKRQKKTFQEILLPDGSTTEDDELISTAIYEFWEPIYNSSDNQTCSVTEFLGNDIDTLPKITDEQRDHFERPISESEVACALKQMKTCAACGFDGIGIAWLRKFYQLLAPILLATYRDAQETGFLPNFMKYAVITLIPKQGKRADLSNWRPISVLPSTYKVYGTLVANRLKTISSELMHSDQKAYISGRQIADVHYNLISEGDYILKNSGKATLVQIDYSKAFDSVHFSAVKDTLLTFGFGPIYITMVMATILGRTASININGKLSKNMLMSNGMPQGDPLAPLLFILVMEMLLHKLRQSPNISAANKIKLQGFADDLTLLLEGTIQNINNALRIIHRFTALSGLKLNSRKTTLLNIGHDGYSQQETELRQLNEVKVLGIKFNNRLQPTLDNFTAKKNKMNIVSNKWNRSFLNIPGRLIVAKSILLPIFTNFGILPGFDHKKLGWELDKKCSLFVWSGQHKIPVKQGYLDKNKGGVKQLCAENLWLSLRINFMKGIFYKTDSWAQMTQSELAEYGIKEFRDLSKYATYELLDLASKINSRLITSFLQDLIRFQILFFDQHPAKILNEYAFFNHWGSYQSSRLQKGPRIGHKAYDCQFGLRHELLSFLPKDATYFDVLQVTVFSQSLSTAPQRKYLKTFTEKIKRMVSEEDIAIYITGNRILDKLNSIKKPRDLLKPRQEHVSQNLVSRWQKIMPMTSPLQVKNYLSIKLFENDSRILDFQIRFSLIILGFRRNVSKYKDASPECYLCQEPNALHESNHTFIDCEFAVAVRKLAQDTFMLPGPYNLNLISPLHFYFGITYQEALEYDLNYHGVNRLLLMIKYSIWICSLTANSNLCHDKAMRIIKQKMYGRFVY